MQACQNAFEPWWRHVAAATSGDMNADSGLLFVHSILRRSFCVMLVLTSAIDSLDMLLLSESRLKPRFWGLNQESAWVRKHFLTDFIIPYTHLLPGQDRQMANHGNRLFEDSYTPVIISVDSSSARKTGDYLHICGKCFCSQLDYYLHAPICGGRARECPENTWFAAILPWQ